MVWPVVVATLAAVAAAASSAVELGGAASGKKQAAGSSAKAPLSKNAHRLGKEIVSLRTRTSRTYVGPRGARVTRISPVSLHAKNRRGRWVPIDSRLVRKGARFVNRHGGYSASLPARLGDAPVRVRKGSRFVDFALRGAAATAEIRGNRARYADAVHGVDLRYVAEPDGLKEELILASPSSQRRFVFDLRLSRGLRPRILKSNAMVLVDRRRRTRMSVPAPYMFDAKGRKSSQVALSLKNVDGRWRLTVTPNAAWLEKTGRAWPVTVDPYFASEPDRDCTLDQASPETSKCLDSGLEVGGTGGAEKQSVVKFDLSSIPGRAEVLYSSLELDVLTANNSGHSMQVYAQPLDEPFTGAATWNRNDGTDRWSEPGGEYDSLHAGYEEEFNGSGTSQSGFWQVQNIVKGWVKGTRPNHGFVLRRNPSTGNGTATTVFSATETGASTWPVLDVEWVDRPGMRRGYKLETQQLSDRISLSVNAGNGNLIVNQTDFSMPGGLGPDVQVSRTYNSVQTEDGALGRGWTLNTGHDIRARWAVGAGVRLYGASGLRLLYESRNGSSTAFDSPPGRDDTMTRNSSSGEITLTDNASQTKQKFNSSGRLTSIEDRNGRALALAYPAGDRVGTITDSNGDAVTFDYTGGSATKLIKFTDPASRQYQYTYDASNRLTGYTDPQNGASYKTLYEYSGPGNTLSKITTPGGRITTIEYYPDGHKDARKVKRVTRVTNPTAMSGPTTLFSYYAGPEGDGITHVTDPLGEASDDDANDRMTRYRFDDQLRVTEVRDALNRKTSTKLTSNSNVENYTAAGNTGTTPNTSFTYDGDDNLTATSTPTTSAGGDPMTTSMSYGTAGQINTGTTGSQYLQTAQTNEQGAVTKTNYQAAGDTNGNPSGIARYKSDGTTLEANVSMQYAPTSGTGASIDGKTGQLKSITDGRSKVTEYGYDGDGNVTSVNPPGGGGTNELGTTEIAYHAGLARVEAVRDGKGKCRALIYDSLDRLTKIEFRGTCTAASSPGTHDTGEPYVEYTYDRDGNQTAEMSGVKGSTPQTRGMTYDDLNRVTFESLPGGASNTYTYDLVGNLRSLTDAGGKVEYTYDAANQQRAVYEPGTAKPTKFKHNKDGLRTETAYPNGVKIAWGYDHANRLETIKSTGPSANTLQELAYKYRQPSSPNRQTPLRYEAEDTVLSRRTRYDYDGLDRLTDATTKTNSGTADDLGWNAASIIARYRYGLDAAGNITRRETDGSGLTANVTNLAYDEANQLCWRSPTNGAAIPSTPCATGTRQTTFDQNGNETTGASGTSRTAVYNDLDQTTSFTIASTTTALSYLGAGQDRWTQEGSSSFQHNVLGVGSRASTYFTRDEAGGLVSRRSGATRDYYLFDALGSVTGVTGSGGSVSERYDYEPYGGREMSTLAAPGSTDVASGQFGFAGGYRSVGGLYHFGQRFYDPGVMRWTQPDPVDQAGDLRNGNLYLYAGCDPVNYVDPTGESPASKILAKILRQATRILKLRGSEVAVCLNAATNTMDKYPPYAPDAIVIPAALYSCLKAVRKWRRGGN